MVPISDHLVPVMTLSTVELVPAGQECELAELFTVPDLLTAAAANALHTNGEPFCVGGRNKVMNMIRQVLAHSHDVHLDDPDVGQRFNDETFCEAWLPLAHVDGASEAMRVLAWHAAGVIAERWGEGPAGHVEETVIGAAFGHATPPVGLIGATSLPCARRSGEPPPGRNER